MMNDKKDKCEMCGKDLVYALTPDKYKDLKCEFCENDFEANTYCEDGHYICDVCHQSGAIEIIEKVIESTEIKDPFVLAENGTPISSSRIKNNEINTDGNLIG